MTTCMHIVADFGAQCLITEAIMTTFPKDFIIAEEDITTLSSERKAQLEQFLGKELFALPLPPPTKETSRFWTIDPIDGTKGYLRGGQYAICVALVEEGSVVVSVMGCPRLPNHINGQIGTIFVAVKSMGAFEVDLHARQSLRLPALPPKVNVIGAVLAESVESAHTDHSFSLDLVRALHLDPNPVRMDSQCKYGIIARGEAHIYLRRPTKANYQERIWDHAPGNLFVIESGGRVTDFSGKPLQFTPKATVTIEGGGILATNLGTLHDSVLAALHDINQ